MELPLISAPPAAKLQLLAEALALEFSQSLASTQCAAALKRLLPGLEYLSIAVRNPAHHGGLVASANCAAAGPTTLHLHDSDTSAAGVALAREQPLQSSLLDGAAAAVTAAWSDVAQMLAQAPGVTHMLCVPFGCSASPAAAECQVHAGEEGSSSGSGSGTLLLGFAAPPALDAQRKAALALLALLLPEPMARLSGDTLAFVNFATGSSPRCSCCCAHDSDDDEEEAAASPCSNDRPGQSDGDGSGPSQALAVPRSLPPATKCVAAAAAEDAAGPSSNWWDHELGGGKPGAKAAAAPAAPAEHLQPPSAEGRSRRYPLSKALLSAAGEQGEGLLRQSPLTLAFRSPLLEAEYGRWVAPHHTKARMDVLFSSLLLAALGILCFVRPYRLIDGGLRSLLLGLGSLVPLALALSRHRTYCRWREWIATAARLHTVMFVHLVSLHSYQARLPGERADQWITFWMLTGAETLCVSALGFLVRLQLHLPLQLVAMGLSSWHLPRMCAHFYPAVPASACSQSSTAMAAMFGYLLPTVGIRYLEQRSRSLFATQLRAAVAHQA